MREEEGLRRGTINKKAYSVGRSEKAEEGRNCDLEAWKATRFSVSQSEMREKSEVRLHLHHHVMWRGVAEMMEKCRMESSAWQRYDFFSLNQCDGTNPLWILE